MRRYLINLKDRPDRAAEMQQQLDRIGWQAEFVTVGRPQSHGGFPSIGARGCFESHLTILKMGYRTGDHILIMEDDLNFSNEFSKHWPNLLEFMETSDWSILYPAHGLPDQDGIVEIPSSIGMACTHFLIIHRDSVAKIITGLETIRSREPGHADGGPMHVDGAYSTLRKQNICLRTFAFSPALGYQRPSRSDIADLRFYDRVSALRPILAQIRRVKRLVTRQTR